MPYRLHLLVVHQFATGALLPIAIFDTYADAEAARLRKVSQRDAAAILDMFGADYTVRAVEYFPANPLAGREPEDDAA